MIKPVGLILAGGHSTRMAGQSKSHDARLAHFPETTPPAFFDINSPDELQQAAACR